jgi:hypothetical protein
MVVNETIGASLQGIELIDPILQNFQPLFAKIVLVFGGLFGLYIFILVLNVYYLRQKVKILKDIRYDFDQLNAHYNIKNSYYNKKGVAKIWQKLFSLLKTKWWRHKK